MPLPLKVIMGGLVAIIVLTTVFFVSGHMRAMTVTGNLTFPWLIGGLLYVTFWRSRGRWPGVPWHERLMRIITFTR